MPELPEVETVRRGLERRLLGRRLSEVRVTGARTARRTSTATVAAELEGVTVRGVDRRGKYLILGFDHDARAMIHLRMSGQLLIADRHQPRPDHTHVAAKLSDHPVLGHHQELRFVDPRTFGEVVTYSLATAWQRVPELERLGWDPLVNPRACRGPDGDNC